jgi:hypothetical protein
MIVIRHLFHPYGKLGFFAREPFVLQESRCTLPTESKPRFAA